MRHLRSIVFLALTGITFADGPRPGVDWPQFRGISATGIADGKPLRLEWNAAKGDGVAWKTPIPGLAHSSPVIWGDRLFVTTAVPLTGEASLKVGLYGAGDSADDMVEHEYRVYCLDKRDGKILWDRVALKTTPKFKRHTKATHVNSTPVTDGRRVVAFFGTEGVFCYDMDGKLEWKKELGPLDVGPHDAAELQWGFASSPIIAEGRLIVQCDVKEKPFLAALDVGDGREIWRVARDDVPGWSTPTAARVGDDWQILVNGCKHMGAYRLGDGGEVWRMSGGGGIPVPTPVVSGELVYLTSNHRPIKAGDPQKPVFAVRLGAKGELAIPSDGTGNRDVAWLRTQRGNYMQTPLIYRGVAYLCYDNGVVSSFDAETGEPIYRERLGTGDSGYTASAVAGDGKVYFTSETGDVAVVDGTAREFRVLARSAFDDICMATPAISEGRLYWRTKSAVMCIAP
ncbi:MAG: hypothetical protein AMXMBFR47_40500 [Planctomycetota bacterium]